MKEYPTNGNLPTYKQAAARYLASGDVEIALELLCELRATTQSNRKFQLATRLIDELGGTDRISPGG